MTFNWIDIIVVVVVVLMAIQGLRRGFIREALAIIAILAAFFLASAWHKLLSISISWLFPEKTVYIISFFVIWVVMYLALELVGSVLSRILKGLMVIPTLDTLGGIALGAIRGAIVIWLILILGLAIPLPQATSKELKASKAVKWFSPLIEKTYTQAIKLLPKDIPYVKEFFPPEPPSKIIKDLGR